MSLSLQEFADLAFETLFDLEPQDEDEKKFLETVRGQNITFHFMGGLVNDPEYIGLISWLCYLQFNKIIGNFTIIVSF